MASCLFPEVDFGNFVNNMNANYLESTRVYDEHVAPILVSLRSKVSYLRDTVLDENQKQMLATAAKTVVDLFNANWIYNGYTNEFKKTIFALNKLVRGLSSTTFPEDMELILDTILNLAAMVEPWNILHDPAYYTYAKAQMVFNSSRPKTVVQNVNRGGVAVNLTDFFGLFSSQSYNACSTASAQLNHTYDEILVLSNGGSGSTTAMFTYMMSQFVKNADGSGATTPLSIVTFGGTKNGASDIVPAAFPAGVDTPRYGLLILESLCLYMLHQIVPVNDSLKDELATARSAFDDVLIEPPALSDIGHLRVPVFNFYDNFMQPGALPLQFIKIRPEYHIPRYFAHTFIEDSKDLPSLYAETQRFFMNSIGQEPTQAPTTVPQGSTQSPPPVTTTATTVTSATPSNSSVCYTVMVTLLSAAAVSGFLRVM